MRPIQAVGSPSTGESISYREYEARANRPAWDPAHPSSKAIGATELMAYLDGEISLETARDRAIIATRQYAKRQRTWFRARMRGWKRISAHDLY